MYEGGRESTPRGIAIVWRDAEEWGAERGPNFGPNVVSFIIPSGRKRWYDVEAYVPPRNITAINWIRKVLECGSEDMGKLIVGDLNTCLENPRDQWEEQLATVLVVHGLTDQAQHFSPRRKY